MTDRADRPETLGAIRNLGQRVTILEKRLLKRGFEAQPARQFSLITASQADPPSGTGWSFLSTPWQPNAETVTCVGMWAGLGIANPATDTSVALVKNGSQVAYVTIPTSGTSARSACGVEFTVDDVLGFYLADPGSGGSFGLLTVYAVLSSPNQSGGLDFLYTPGGGGG